MEGSPVQSVTSAPENPAAERDQRTRRYLRMMGIRVVCFLLAFVTSGWIQWVCLALAIVLPYIAVVLANAVRPRGVPSEATLAHTSRRQIGRR